MQILHTLTKQQFSDVVFRFKSAEVTDSGADKNAAGTKLDWERGTVTLCADCDGEELIMQFDFILYGGGNIELAHEPDVKYNFRVVDEFFYTVVEDAQSIMDSVPWKCEASRVLGY